MGDQRPVGDVQPFAELFRSATTVVYKGYQRSLDRFVLLKRLSAEASLDERLVERFEEEARLIARVQHPNVVAIYTCGRDDVSSYLVAEFVDGVDLATLIHQQSLPAELAVFILREAVRGLGAAHDRGILHRDIKPSNILVSFGGQVKVADFGMASVVTSEHDGEVRGTLPYLAPEQVQGLPPSVATDFFSLGATFFEMITGRRAFLGSDAGSIFESILHYDPVPLLAGRSSVPAEVVGMCGKLLAREPDERYASWKEVEAEATAFLDSLQVRVGRSSLEAYLTDPEGYVPMSFAPALADEPAAGPAVEDRGVDHDEIARRSLLVPGAILMSLVLLAVFALTGLLSNDRRYADDFSRRMVEDARYPIWLYPEGEEPESEADAAEAQAPRTPARGDDEADEGEGEASFGWLRIEADPWAIVIAGGDTLGRTPFEEPIMRQVGTHRLQFLHPDFPTHRRRVEVRPGETTDVTQSMWDLVGRVTLEVSPWAAVWLNGVARDTIPPQSEAFVLRPGWHRLRLHHPVLGQYNTTFRVGAGETRTLRFNLYDLLGE